MKTILALLFLWLAVILLAPVMMHSDSKLLQYAATFIYLFMDPLCHQLPERSLFMAGLPMPLCGRCFFIYLGGFIVFLWSTIRGTIIPWNKKIYYSFLSVILFQLFLEKILQLDLFVEIRYLSGLLSGVLIFRLILEAMNSYGRKVKNGKPNAL